MNEEDAVRRSVGLVAALMMHSGDSDSDGWCKTIDLMIGDLDLRDMLDLNVQLAGMVVGLIHALVEGVPSLKNMSAGEYLQRLGYAAEVFNDDPNQERLF